MAKRIVTAILDVVKNQEVEIDKAYTVDHIFPEAALEEIEIELLFAALPKHTIRKSLFGREKTELKENWTLNEIRNAYAEMRKKRLEKMRKVFLRLSI